MARKTTGSTTTPKKTTASPEIAAVQPTPGKAVSETRNTVTHTVMAGAKQVANLDEEIRRRAYELYLQRNGSAGDPNRDWFIAEREVRARHAVAGHSA